MEWSSYSIRDFVLFSKEILLEIMEAYNHDFWPWQVLWLGLTLVMLLLLLFPSRARSRIVFALAAGAWAWVGIVFHLQYFLPINWAARYSAGLFLVEALLLAVAATRPGIMDPDRPGPRRKLGIAIFILAAWIPFELAWGQSFAQIMIFGWGPDRTALGTIGLLLTSRPGLFNRALMLPAVIWCVLAAMMHYGLK
jgi:hypothetical protein